MKILYFSILIIPFLACNKFSSKNKSDFQPKEFSYTEMKMPVFFESLVTNHLKDFYSIDHSDYDSLFSENEISEKDSLNNKTFYTIKILHKLFTSKNATNGSKGEILNIPYFWHWINPNPRHEIVSLKTNQKLNQIKPPKEFAKYKSYADIDRTPNLFLSELVSKKELYHTATEGDFSTFGWCSEREMAFVCLLNTLGYKGKVITYNNHSWSEFIVSMKNKNNQTINFKVIVDNTFDNLEWNEISNNEILVWEKQTFKGQGNWYNEKAHSETEKQKTRNNTVETEASKRIEKSVVTYLKK